MENQKAKISLILVDTSAYITANSDFIGFKSDLLPAFFEVISYKGMFLLTHPILEKEIKRHIEDSSIYKDFQDLTKNIRKCESVLKYARCYDSTLVSKIEKFDIKQATYDAYTKAYAEAINLPYCDPQKVFQQYFLLQPPFSSAQNKKSEFPDAFVIQATKDYLEEHKNEVLLVISRDSDWQNAFKDSKQIVFCESIKEAIKIVNEIASVFDTDELELIFDAVIDDAKKSLELDAMFECYNLPGYDFIDGGLDSSVAMVKSISKDFVPLRISRNSLLIQTFAEISVSGSGIILDEEHSCWDSENKDYIFKSYADLSFDDGIAVVDCEFQIDFDFDAPIETATVVKSRICNKGNIDIEVDCVTLYSLNEDEAASLDL